jgi:polyhydroxybutyrate depolymerase
VKRRRRRQGLAWLGLAGMCLTAVACSRANLDAITRMPTGDGGGGAGGAPPVTCPSPALLPGDSMQTVQVGGVSRSYALHVPQIYDGSKPVPLIVDFHGMATSGPQYRSMSPYPDETDAEGVIMAFPSGLVGPRGASWNVGPCCVANVDDVAFARALVAEISRMACVDPKRVYAAGFATGGGMAHYLACHAADVFAAVAPSAFDLLEENVGDCQPLRPITVISFRGAADTLVPYDGGPSAVVPGMPVTFLGALATFQKWADIDRCTGTPSAPDSDGCSTYANCQGGVEVVLCTDQGGGTAVGDASVAWPVLKRHPLP